MTVTRDIEIVQGQTWTELFLVADLVPTGNGLRLHIRDHHGATLLRAALAHDNAANERISFATGGVLANLGASISTAWDLQGQPVRRWVYSIERYSLTDVDDVSVLFMGAAIVKSNPTDESSITKVTPHPSYDESCIRFDLVQTLTEPQKARARSNIGVGDEGALAAWGGIGGTLADQTDLVTALALKATVASPTFTGVPVAPTAAGGTNTTQLATTAFAVGEVTTHAGAADPHPGYLQNLGAHATAAILVVVGTDGTELSRSSYTTATLITAAAAAAPVQSVAGRTGAVVIAVADVSGAESTANKAQPSGYASLDSDGKVPQAQLPAIAITEYLGSVASQVAMLALSGQKGDWCTRSDSPGTWIITGTDPTLLGSWTQIVHPTDAVTSVAGRTGAVTLSASDVSGLGGAAVLSVGTSAGTVAAGDDARIVGAVQTSRTVSTSGLATGGGDLSANRTITVTASTAATVSTGTATTEAVTPGAYKDSTPYYVDRAADWTLALTDRNKDQWFNNGASALVCTIPLNATVAFAIGDTIPFVRLASGTATIDAATSVTLNGVSGGSCTISTQYQGALLKKIATDSWVVSGDVSAVA